MIPYISKRYNKKKHKYDLEHRVRFEVCNHTHEIFISFGPEVTSLIQSLVYIALPTLYHLWKFQKNLSTRSLDNAYKKNKNCNREQETLQKQ